MHNIQIERATPVQNLVVENLEMYRQIMIALIVTDINIASDLARFVDFGPEQLTPDQLLKWATDYRNSLMGVDLYPSLVKALSKNRTPLNTHPWFAISSLENEVTLGMLRGQSALIKMELDTQPISLANTKEKAALALMAAGISESDATTVIDQNWSSMLLDRLSKLDLSEKHD